MRINDLSTAILSGTRSAAAMAAAWAAEGCGGPSPLFSSMPWMDLSRFLFNNACLAMPVIKQVLDNVVCHAVSSMLASLMPLLASHFGTIFRFSGWTRLIDLAAWLSTLHAGDSLLKLLAMAFHVGL